MDGSVTISLQNFVGEGIIIAQYKIYIHGLSYTSISRAKMYTIYLEATPGKVSNYSFQLSFHLEIGLKYIVV